MLALFLAGLAAPASAAPNATSTIYIIRHGEKKWALGCLSDQGQHRAEQLVGIFNGRASATHATFATPRGLFANFYDDPVDCERCNQTLAPISAALKLPIDLKYGFAPWVGGNAAAAAAMAAALGEAGTLLVAWEHMNIKPLTVSLGVPAASIPSWAGDDFDSVYVLRFDRVGVLSSFEVKAENVTQGAAGGVEAGGARGERGSEQAPS